MPAIAASATPGPATPIALAGTIAVTALFFAATAHVAARYVLGDVPAVRALGVGITSALVVTALIRYPPAVVALTALAADVAAFRLLYRLQLRTAAWVAVVHYLVTLLVVLAVTWTLALRQSAPG